jgi:Tfp pilus assembly protein PilX
LPLFLLRTLQSAVQAARAEGNLAVALLRDREDTFWTATSWSTESSIKAFMLAGPHGAVMRRLPGWCDEAALVHWTQESAELPSWEEAHAKLQRAGRPSRVHHPSAAHAAYEIARPALGRTRQLRLR